MTESELAKKRLSGAPRSFADYRVAVHRDRLPSGVELIEA